MCTKNKIFHFLFIIFLFAIVKVSGQDMMMPPPVEVKVFDMIEGEWVSDPYQMMGMTVVENVNHHWEFNHQYFVIDIKTDNYEGKGYMTSDKEGTVKGWWFDGYGPSMMTTYTGTTDMNSITIHGTGPMVEETREIDIMGDVMIHKVDFKMKDKDGNEETMNNTITYRRKN